MKPIDELLKEVWACPCDAHGDLVETPAGLKSVCCGQTFKVDDGIAVLLTEGIENAG